jgi:hypothetical protein
MNTLKSVFNKVSKIEKVELSDVEKIELSIVDDLEKAVNTLQDEARKANDWVKDYDTKVNLALRNAANSIQNYVKQKPLVGTGAFAEGIIDSAIRQGRELGVDMRNNPMVKRLQFAIGALKEALRNLDKTELQAEQQVKKLR